MKIHLKSKQGMYTVKSYTDTYILLATKHSPMFKVPCSDFKAFAGGNFNHDVTQAESDRFLSVVNPTMYQQQNAMTEQIITIAHAIDKLENAMSDVSIQQNVDDDEADNTDYEHLFHQKSEDFDIYKDKIRKSASQVYKQKLDFSEIQNYKGIKFIIQANSDVTEFRFCFDPYQFVDNFHSAISDIYSEIGWSTINGGWIRIFGKRVVLYSKSGDYGVYKDSIAIAAASKLFPNHEISSYAGRQWDAELNDRYDDLPF